jgi:hypothetical protein
MNDKGDSLAARVIRLYLDHPGTPDMPSSADWNIARSLDEWGISFDTIQLAFRLAFIRRARSSDEKRLPPIRSLAYFRAVALNLTPQERDPAYSDYVEKLYEQLQTTESSTANENRAPQPESRGLS